MSWDPISYLKFHSERTQPSIDLVSRIILEQAKDILDLGCGPGNSTEILMRRWPEAKTVGLDSSSSMIKKARHDFPRNEWIIADAALYKPNKQYDLVFSNAALQWIPNHNHLLPELFGWLKPGGILAVQVPANSDSALHLALIKVSHFKKWYSYTRGCESLIFYDTPGFIYNVLSPHTELLNIWESTYYHVLESHNALIDWYRSTGMRTYLERLPDDFSRKEFESEVLQEILTSYSLQADNKVIFPFKRLFFIAHRKL